MQQKSTINLKEVSKFGKFAKNWWNENANEAKMLHKMNPMRIGYILEKCGDLKGKKVLDVGCGGGILSIPLLRLGANLTGVEPATELYEVAKQKAEEEGLKAKFLNCGIEDVKGKFNVILLMDILEHVDNVPSFLEKASSLLEKEGVLIISTINKTMLSSFLVKFMAEYVLKIIPKGTHEPEKFLTPEFIESNLKDLQKLELKGFFYNPISGTFKLTEFKEMNYFLTFISK